MSWNPAWGLHQSLVWEQLSSLAVRQHTPLALLVMDLVQFKRVNDRHGHLGGDACLRHFAALLGGRFRRESDFIARIGGSFTSSCAPWPGCRA